MQAPGETRLLPPWRHALTTLLDAGLENGHVISRERLSDLFGLTKPVTAEDQEKFQLDFLAAMTELRTELLESHRIALRTLHGESAYEVLPPAQQTDYAMKHGLREMKRASKRMVSTLKYVRYDELTAEEKRKNADAQAKAAMLAGMVRNARLPVPTSPASRALGGGA